MYRQVRSMINNLTVYNMFIIIWCILNTNWANYPVVTAKTNQDVKVHILTGQTCFQKGKLSFHKGWGKGPGDVNFKVVPITLFALTPFFNLKNSSYGWPDLLVMKHIVENISSHHRVPIFLRIVSDSKVCRERKKCCKQSRTRIRGLRDEWTSQLSRRSICSHE